MVRYLSQLLAALECLHAMSIAHLDIKVGMCILTCFISDLTCIIVCFLLGVAEKFQFPCDSLLYTMHMTIFMYIKLPYFPPPSTPPPLSTPPFLFPLFSLPSFAPPQPENILISGMEENPIIKLIDFGSAQELNDDIALVASSSPEFSAPEVIGQEGAQLVSDMWSVGVLTYIL